MGERRAGGHESRRAVPKSIAQWVEPPLQPLMDKQFLTPRPKDYPAPHPTHVDYDFDWSYIWQSRLPLLRGLQVTLEVSAIGIALAIIVGVIGGFVRLFQVRGANQVVIGYVELIRNTPILAQLFFIFYGLPELGMKPSPFWSGVLMLTLWGGAYNVESMRGALDPSIRGCGRQPIRSGCGARSISASSPFRSRCGWHCPPC